MWKKHASSLFAALLLTSYGWGAKPKPAKVATTPAVTLPESIASTMNQEYPGWKLAPVNAEVQKSFKAHAINHPPSLLSADFNGDGKRDYAVQIVITEPGQEEQIVIVFLQKEDGFQEMILQSQGLDSSLYLWVGKKLVTETGPAGQEQHHQKDVLTVMGGPIGDTTYAFQNGEFHEMRVDEEGLPGEPAPEPTQ